MYEKFKENVKKYKLIEEGGTVLVGVSGGYDSMALLIALIRLSQEMDLRIIVLHVNHMVRDQAQADEDFVRDFSLSQDLDFYSKSVDMVGYAKEQGLSEEDAGRRLRYKFFHEVADEYLDSVIATGHNLPDQAETILLNLIRGTGLRGLAGMDFKSGRLIRPLLNIAREEIESFVDEAGTGHREDETNLQSHYRRNSIRNQLIPFIKENYNPNFEASLFSMSQILKEDQALIDGLVDQTMVRLVEEEGEGYSLDKEGFLALTRPLQSHLIRRIIEKIRGSLSGFTSSHIEEFIKTASRPAGRYSKIKGVVLITEYDRIRLFLEGLKEDLKSLKVGIYDRVFTFGDYLIEFKVLKPGQEEIEASKNCQYFDLDQLDELTLRTRQDGDRMRPYGMNGSKKVKDILIDEKIARDKRDRIPIFTDCKDLIWLAGVRRSNHYLVKDSSQEVLRITVEEIGDHDR